MPKTPSAGQEEQGELFPTVISTGANEAEILDVTEAGVFPSDIETDEGHITMAAFEAAREKAAQATKNRSEAQKGKHTVAEGESPKPGDVLPSPAGLQPVTWTNLNAAVTVVAEERAAREKEAARQPSLFADAKEVVGEVAAQHSIGAALEGPDAKTAPNAWFTLDTLSKRLEVIVEQAIGAKFIPATKDELTDALPTVEYPYSPGAVHDELMATYGKQARLARKKGHGQLVASWEGQRAIISRIYEMADSLADAKGSFQLLSELQPAVDQTHGLPTLSVKEVFQDNDRALLALRVAARDLLILKLKDQKLSEDELGFKSMTAREVRTYKRPKLPVLEDESPEAIATFERQRKWLKDQAKKRSGLYSARELLQRDKTLYSPFVPLEDVYDEKLEAYVDAFMKETTIGQLRRTRIAEKLASLQQNRYWHWRRSIADVRGYPYTQVTEPILAKYPEGLVAA